MNTVGAEIGNSVLLFFFTFVGPCIVNVFKQNQRDAKLHNGIYYYKCFRRFLRLSSGV